MGLKSGVGLNFYVVQKVHARTQLKVFLTVFFDEEHAKNFFLNSNHVGNLATRAIKIKLRTIQAQSKKKTKTTEEVPTFAIHIEK